jgi:hypothetical protein
MYWKVNVRNGCLCLSFLGLKWHALKTLAEVNTAVFFIAIHPTNVSKQVLHECSETAVTHLNFFILKKDQQNNKIGF